MCGVLRGICEDIEHKLDTGAYRITAFVKPFMAGKYPFLEIEGSRDGGDCEASFDPTPTVAISIIGSGGACPPVASMSEFPTLTGYYRFLFLYLEPCKRNAIRLSLRSRNHSIDDISCLSHLYLSRRAGILQ